MKINFHIERLVLGGISVEPGQHLALEVATTSEFGRLLAVEGVDSCIQLGGSTQAICGGIISVGENRELTELGQQIARAVYRGIAK